MLADTSINPLSIGGLCKPAMLTCLTSPWLVVFRHELPAEATCRGVVLTKSEALQSEDWSSWNHEMSLCAMSWQVASIPNSLCLRYEPIVLLKWKYRWDATFLYRNFKLETYNLMGVPMPYNHSIRGDFFSTGYLALNHSFQPPLST